MIIVFYVLCYFTLTTYLYIIVLFYVSCTAPIKCTVDKIIQIKEINRYKRFVLFLNLLK